MTPTDIDLYERGARSLLASWEAYARGTRHAAVVRRHGVAAAVFPHEPERAVYNNALLERGLSPGGRREAIEGMEVAYASSGVTRFAAWVHETDHGMRDALEARGYTVDTSTRAMGIALSDIRLPRPTVDLAPPHWRDYLEYLRRAGLPAGFLEGVDGSEFHLLIARADGEIAATALALDCGGDCGIYNVSTAEFARRRGLATALSVLSAHDAHARGCRTASLQATPSAERIYTKIGFRDLGRILEYSRSPGDAAR